MASLIAAWGFPFDPGISICLLGWVGFLTVLMVFGVAVLLDAASMVVCFLFGPRLLCSCGPFFSWAGVPVFSSCIWVWHVGCVFKAVWLLFSDVLVAIAFGSWLFDAGFPSAHGITLVPPISGVFPSLKISPGLASLDAVLLLLWPCFVLPLLVMSPSGGGGLAGVGFATCDAVVMPRHSIRVMVSISAFVWLLSQFAAAWSVFCLGNVLCSWVVVMLVCFVWVHPWAFVCLCFGLGLVGLYCKCR